MSTSASAATLTSTRDFQSASNTINDVSLASNASYATPATIPLAAMPAAGTTITRIEVYAGPTLIASNSNSANSSTLNTTWITLKPGTQTLTARAIDSNGGISTASVTITVTSAANETITFIHNDLAGSPMAATDINGAIVWKEDYSPYGERKQNEAAASNQHQWFGGKVADSETGLSYFGARYYDPVVGRFMGIDPVTFQTGNLHSFNRYAYANNNPYKYVDPDGRAGIMAIVVPIIVIGTLGYAVLTPEQRTEITQGLANVVRGSFDALRGSLDGFLISHSPGPVISNSDGGDVGSYTNTHGSGKKYHGKGPKSRSKTSGKEVGDANDDPLVGTDWTPAANDQEAFKDEARRIRKDKDGVKSEENYNKINSPGEKLLKKDGE